MDSVWEKSWLPVVQESVNIYTMNNKDWVGAAPRRRDVLFSALLRKPTSSSALKRRYRVSNTVRIYYRIYKTNRLVYRLLDSCFKYDAMMKIILFENIEVKFLISNQLHKESIEYRWLPSSMDRWQSYYITRTGTGVLSQITTKPPSHLFIWKQSNGTETFFCRENIKTNILSLNRILYIFFTWNLKSQNRVHCVTYSFLPLILLISYSNWYAGYQ